MGFYTDGNVYGVWCFMYGIEEYDDLIVFIDKKYDSKMNSAQIEEVKAEYEQISEENKSNNRMMVGFYAMVSSSHDTVPSITSWPGSREMLEEFLSGTNIRLFSCETMQIAI